MILVDTSLLVDALTGQRPSEADLRGALADGERLVLPSLVLYEWLRGPRLDEELLAQATLFPDDSVVPFGPREASMAADLYRLVPRARTREIDLAIAACALAQEAALWTLNRDDFSDVPGLLLYARPRHRR